MRLIAIDPGTTKSAYVIYDGKKILRFGKVNNSELLGILKSSFFSFNLCLIEQFKNYGRAANAGQSIFEACRWSGRFEQVCHDKKLKCAFIPRKTVVSHHTGSATRGDKDVRAAIIKKYPKGTKQKPLVTYGLTTDSWQAFAIATYYFETFEDL